MYISDDIEKYLKYYMGSIFFLGELRISAIEQMVEYQGQGNEYIACTFDPDDEEYKEGYVALLFWYPAEKEDTMVYVDKYLFYEHLLNVCEEYIKNKLEIKDKVEGYLEQIKVHLKI